MPEKPPPPGVAQHPSAPAVPGYILTLPLARTASTEVWKAWVERTGKEVALKVLRGLGDDERAGLRASVERLIVLDRHPNVVAVLDADLSAEPAWVATDLLESGSLQSRIDSGTAVSAGEAARWLEDTARALAYVHGRGVFHGNLKPSNILLDEEGRPRLLDFGGGGDAASDGAALAAAVRAALGASPVDEDLEAVLAKCAAPDPAERYPSMAELAADLESRRQNLPVRPLQHRRAYVVRKFLGRHTAAAALAATLAASVVWGLVAVAARNAALTGELAAAYSQRGRIAVLQGDPAAAALLFAKGNALRPSDDARRDAQAVLSQLARPRASWSLGAPVAHLAVSPDGERFVAAGEELDEFRDARTGAAVGVEKASTLNLALMFDETEARFTADGSRVFYMGKDGNMPLRDGRTGKLVARFMGMHGELSPKGVVAVSELMKEGQPGAPVTLYDSATGKPTGVKVVHEMESDNTAAVRFSPDGEVFLTCGGGRILVWDTATGRRVGGVAYRPRGGGGYLNVSGLQETGFFGSSDEVWVRDGDELLTFDAVSGAAHGNKNTHQGPARAVEGRGGKTVTGGEDGTVQFWAGERLVTDSLHRSLRHTGPVNVLALSPDGHLVASGGEDGTVRFWSWDSLGPIGVLLPHGGPVTALSFSSDGKTVATGGRDGVVRLWDVPNDARQELDVDAMSLVLSPDGSRGVRFDFRDGYSLVSLPDGAVLAGDLAPAGESGQGEISYTPSGDRALVVPAHSPEAFVWDVRAGKKVAGPLAHPFPTTAKPTGLEALKAELSPDGRAAATSSGDGRVLVWDLSRPGAEPLAMKVKGDPTGLTFSPDGRRLAVLEHDRVDVWSLPPGPRPLWSAPVGGWNALWTPDGRRVVVAGGKNARLHLLDAGDGSAVGPASMFAGWAMITRASPDGTRVIAALSDGTARLIDAATGEFVGPVLRHDKALYGGAFSPDSAVVALGGLDGTVVFWDARTGEPTGRPLRQPFGVDSLAFTPDSKSLFAAGGMKLSRWDVGWLKAPEAADALLGRAEETAHLRLDAHGVPRALPAPEK